MIVKIPVAPISRKIMISERGGEPILFNTSDIYHQLISYQRKKYRGNINKLTEVLTTYVEIIINDRRAREVKKSAWQIGYHLLCYHYDRMEQHVWTSKKAGVPATRAIDSFYAEYGITEEDFARESAYKRWQRFAVKKNKVIYNNTRQQIDLPPVQRKKTSKDLKTEAGKIIGNNIHFFLIAEKKWSAYAVRDLYIYLFRKHEAATVPQLAAQYNISERSIYRIFKQTSEIVKIYGLIDSENSC